MVVARKHHDLYQELGAIVGAQYVSDDLADLLPYTRDMSIHPPREPQGAVVRPSSVEEVVALVKLANQTRTPLIPMGGKSTISGTPPGQPGRGIIVDMRRMDKLIEIDEANMAVTAQCGITEGELAGKLREKGFNIHTAGQPHYTNTIGGHISGEPGAGFGPHGYSVGWNWQFLLGMKVVLPDGSVIDTGTGEGSFSAYKGHTYARAMNGPDVSGIFIGDGGIFGIKVEASYRMHHLPKFTRGSARAWDEGDLEGCFAAYYELWGNDPHLYMQSYSSGMLLGPEYIGMVEPKAPPQWILWFLHVGNSEEEVELKYKNCEAVCARHGGKVASPAILDFASGFLQWAHDMNKMATLGLEPLMELIVSRRDILECFKWSREYLFKELADHGIDKTKIPYITGLLSSGPGCGMTTVIPYLDQSDPEQVKAIREIWIKFLEQARRRGYGIEATQGHMSREMAKSWTPEFYHFIRTMKQRMDPNNIMNPGVFFD